MDRLSEFELEVLESLPFEPTGLSLAELADGLLNDRSPRAKGRIRRALDGIEDVLGGLYVRTGDDDFGHFGIAMYGVPRNKMPLVRAFFVEKGLVNV